MTELQIIEDFNRGTGQMNNLVAQLLALDLDCDWSTRREAADTLLALQTQLAAAELKAKEWIDVAYEAASQKEELKRELERVERALQNFIDIDDDCGLMVDGNAGSELVVALSKAREALPSAKTAQTEQQKG